MGIKKHLLLVIFMLLGLIQILAQVPELEHTEIRTEKTACIGTALGYSFTGYREETTLPLGRYLNTLTLLIDGNIEKKSFLHSYNLGFFSGESSAIKAYPLNEYELQPDIVGPYFEYYQIEDTFTRIFAEYALDYSLWGNRTFPGYLGGALRVDVYLIETLNNLLYLNFTGLVSLNLHASQKWIIKEKNNLVFAAAIPIFGYAIRPAYIGFSSWPLETEFVSLHNYQAIFGELKYQYKFNKLISLNTGLGFELSHINFPRPRNDAALRIVCGITVNYR
jgi:hypothetical protein